MSPQTQDVMPSLKPTTIARAWPLVQLLLLGTLASACVTAPGHTCSTTAQCGPTGQCEATGACSFAAADCESGRRYGSYATAELANQCVSPTQVVPSGCIIGAEGSVIDDDAPCFVNRGLIPHAGGYANTHFSTIANAAADPEEWGTWMLAFTQNGRYTVEVYAEDSQTQRARYEIRAGSLTDYVLVDQSARNGWTQLGTYTFTANANQYIKLPDNTGEPVTELRRIIYDAVRILPVP